MYSEPGAQGSDAEEVTGRLFSQECADDPHVVYREMHAKCPVATQEGMFGGTSMLVTKYDEVLWALKHPEVFSSKDVVDIGGEFPLIPLSVDPPEHAKYRRLLDPEFSPKKMAALEPEFRKFVNETIDVVHRPGRGRLPRGVRVAAAVDVLPRARPACRTTTFRSSSSGATTRSGPRRRREEELMRIRAEAGAAIQDYFEAQLEEKRRDPDDRLFSRMVHGEVDGRPMTHAELLGACHLLLLGGLDTVTATLDCMIVYLARAPRAPARRARRQPRL